MMKKQFIILFLGLLFPMMAFSQTDVALAPEFGGRVSLKSVEAAEVVVETHLLLKGDMQAFDNPLVHTQGNSSANFRGEGDVGLRKSHHGE